MRKVKEMGSTLVPLSPEDIDDLAELLGVAARDPRMGYRRDESPGMEERREVVRRWHAELRQRHLANARARRARGGSDV